MKGHWATVWEIASNRHQTNIGEDHLTDHAREVLHRFMVEEAQNAMSQAMGGAIFIFHG